MIIIDAKNKILGRLATVVAKKALLGENIAIINCEEAIISGDKRRIISVWKHKKEEMGVPRKGPFIYKRPDAFVKRTIRGMIPYKKPRGREAFKRIKCYIGNPNIEGNLIEVKEADISNLSTTKFIKIGELCKELGWQL